MKTKTKLIYMLFSLAPTLPLSAQNEALLQIIKAANNDLMATQAYLHQHPELPGKEFETSAFLQAEIEKLGLPITKVQGTGFFALLDTQRPGKTIGLRTDIDALPVPENDYNAQQKRLYISQNEGVFHACGHDGHMAILLEAAKILTGMKDRLNG
ncbi:MAG: M20/M25/M40 family metallo-hydrolase, partial [Prevotellaceae bacterium]|nr:M20/M25/M40 family metallo-hydrolase [Prevotellaceae bacterium]